MADEKDILEKVNSWNDGFVRHSLCCDANVQYVYYMDKYFAKRFLATPDPHYKCDECGKKCMIYLLDDYQKRKTP